MIIPGIDIFNENVTSNSFYTPDSRCDTLFCNYFEATYFSSIANMGSTTKFQGYAWDFYDAYLQSPPKFLENGIYFHKFYRRGYRDKQLPKKQIIIKEKKNSYLLFNS